MEKTIEKKTPLDLLVQSRNLWLEQYRKRLQRLARSQNDFQPIFFKPEEKNSEGFGYD